ncbi:hypothetical protein EDB81DRAFT_807371 [Dactylonectria macrodidyma]|uniref:Transmembrane protein n=1 Tax=Dactylonectria macrodidyma TaxID=307937 RepID=A0A9P9E6V6_9HYPO|nr:hypothetical protein EDB81DRAFT_807371 [Dactylonectria macrodidyma]
MLEFKTPGGFEQPSLAETSAPRIAVAQLHCVHVVAAALIARTAFLFSQLLFPCFSCLSPLSFFLFFLVLLAPFSFSFSLILSVHAADPSSILSRHDRAQTKTRLLVVTRPLVVSFQRFSYSNWLLTEWNGCQIGCRRLQSLAAPVSQTHPTFDTRLCVERDQPLAPNRGSVCRASLRCHMCHGSFDDIIPSG